MERTQAVIEPRHVDGLPQGPEGPSTMAAPRSMLSNDAQLQADFTSKHGLTTNAQLRIRASS